MQRENLVRGWLFALLMVAPCALASDWKECLKTPVYREFTYATANDAWRKPIGKYSIKQEGLVAAGFFKVLFAAEDFNALKKDSAKKCGTRLCSSRTVFEVKDDAAVKELRKNLLKDRAPDAGVELVKAALAEFPGAGWGMTLIDLTMKLTPAVHNAERMQSHLDALIEKGGAVVYEEHLTSQTTGGCFRLTRSVFYEVKVGTEMRRVLLWAARYTAESE